jgi:hypothetical protein
VGGGKVVVRGGGGSGGKGQLPVGMQAQSIHG